MKNKLKKRVWFIPTFTALVAGVIYGVVFLCLGYIPSIDKIMFFDKVKDMFFIPALMVNLPVSISRLWDIPVIFIFTLTLILIIRYLKIVKGKNENLFYEVVVSIVSTLMLACLLGVFFGFIAGFLIGLEVGLFFLLIISLLIWLRFTFIFGLLYGPVIVLNFGLTFGLTVGLAIGLGIGLTLGLAIGLTLGLVIGLIFEFIVILVAGFLSIMSRIVALV